MSATDTTDPLAPAARADAYLADVRRHLDERADLGDDERDDLLDELTAHVHEVAASDDRPLDEALGSPAVFAAELLASAGLATDGSPPRPAPLPGWAETAWQGVSAVAASLRARRWARWLAAFLRDIRPAWWVARGPLIVYGIWLWGDVYGTAQDDVSFLPHVFNQKLLGALLMVAAAVASVQLARRRTRRGWNRLVNVAAVAGGIVLWTAAYTIDVILPDYDGDPLPPSYQLPPAEEPTPPDAAP